MKDLVRTWVAVVTAIGALGAAVGAMTTQGLSRLVLVGVCTVASVAVWRWRYLLSNVRNVELLHSLHILNVAGDARYEQTAAILPILWPAREYEVLLHNLGAEDVRDVHSSVPVRWHVKEKTRWRGIASPPVHKPLISPKRGKKGASVTVGATFPAALGEELCACSFATTNKPPTRLRLRVRWSRGVDVRIADLFRAPVKFVSVGKGEYNPEDVAWRYDRRAEIELLSDGSRLIEFTITNPRPDYIYRVVWSV